MRFSVIPSSLAASACLALLSGAAQAAPVSYKIDPSHTFPSFEADHMGISIWRGKINKNSGSVHYDKADGSGKVDIEIDLGSIDFGHEPLNAWARGKHFFDTRKHPKARYQGQFAAVVDRLPTQLVGELSLRGQTRPLLLQIHSLKCIPHPLFKRELCGADASGSFQRDEFGLDAGKDYGFKMEVRLRIQVEALAAP